jgi:hypothetical protein
VRPLHLNRGSSFTLHLPVIVVASGC